MRRIIRRFSILSVYRCGVHVSRGSGAGAGSVGLAGSLFTPIRVRTTTTVSSAIDPIEEHSRTHAKSMGAHIRGAQVVGGTGRELCYDDDALGGQRPSFGTVVAVLYSPPDPDSRSCAA